MWNQRLTYPSDLDEILECDTELNKNLIWFGDPRNPTVGSITFQSISAYMKEKTIILILDHFKKSASFLKIKTNQANKQNKEENKHEHQTTKHPEIVRCTINAGEYNRWCK